MLILNKINIDSLNLLSDLYKNIGNLNIYEYLQSHETLIKQKSKILEKDITPNTYIVKPTRHCNDLLLGFISDIPIIKIDILHEINDNNYQHIYTDHPQNKNMDIEIEINDETQIMEILLENNNKIKKNNTNVYILSEPIYFYPYTITCCKLYFDKNIDITNNNLYDVGIFIQDKKYRQFIINTSYENIL